MVECGCICSMVDDGSLVPWITEPHPVYQILVIDLLMNGTRETTDGLPPSFLLRRANPHSSLQPLKSPQNPDLQVFRTARTVWSDKFTLMGTAHTSLTELEMHLLIYVYSTPVTWPGGVPWFSAPLFIFVCNLFFIRLFILYPTWKVCRRPEALWRFGV